ncbi:MAG: DinB family protein, partial [Terracidiphilus sp.]
MSPVQAQEELLNLFEQEFMGVAQAMPADKYGFAPTAAIFAASQGVKYDGVRTFAQVISHVTT